MNIDVPVFAIGCGSFHAPLYLDVRQERVAQTRARRRTPYQSGNVRHKQVRRDDSIGLVQRCNVVDALYVRVI